MIELIIIGVFLWIMADEKKKPPRNTKVKSPPQNNVYGREKLTAKSINESSAADRLGHEDDLEQDGCDLEVSELEDFDIF